MNAYKPARNRNAFGDTYNTQQSYGNYQPPGGYQGLSPNQPTYGTDMGMSQGPRQQQYGGYGGQQPYGGQFNQMSYGGDTYTGQPYQGIGNPMQGGVNGAQFGNPAGGYGGPGGYTPPAGGPYGSGDMSQSPYNPNGPMSNQYRDAWLGAITKMQEHSLGDLNDPKNQAAQQVWLSQYANPLIQAQQNMYTQQANQAQWGANFNEQQYLNRNQTGLDWAASGREDAGLNYAIQSGQQNFGEGQRQFDVTSAQGQQKLDTEQAQQQALARYQRGEISLGEAQNQISAARQRSDAAIGKKSGETAQYSAVTGRRQVQNDYAVAQVKNQIAAEQNDIDAKYKAGLITVQQKDAQTSALKEKHDFMVASAANANTLALGKGQLANQQFSNVTQRRQAQNELTLGQGQLANQRFANTTGRMQTQNDYQIAQQQIQLDTMYKTGQLSNDQYQAQTARLQQQSQESQWQQQLAAQQGQFGQNLALQYAQMKQDAMNQRYAQFGRALAPNMAAMNQSWY